jgi:hypothetical protein
MKWRPLLATLLINAGQVVSTGRLIMEMWADIADFTGNRHQPGYVRLPLCWSGPYAAAW